MKYIFEDNESHYLHKFFRRAYPEDAVRNFVYAHSNGKLVHCLSTIRNIGDLKTIQRKVGDRLFNTWLDKQDNSETYMFIDVCPGNIQTIDTYLALRKIIKINNLQEKVLVIPIVCFEYYAVVYMYKMGLIKDNALEIVQRCINVDPYYLIKDDIAKSSLLVESNRNVAKFLDKSKSFENLCKDILDIAVKECAKDGGEWFSGDCLCKRKLHECKEIGISSKVLEFIKCFNYIPCGSFNTDAHTLDIKEYSKISKDCLDFILGCLKVCDKDLDGEAYVKLENIRDDNII